MTVRLFHAITATACLLILLCQNLCLGTVCAAEISQEEIDSRLERLAKELLSQVKPHEFVSDFDRQSMYYELGELLLKNGQDELAGAVLAQIYESQWIQHAITYSEAARQLLKRSCSKTAILEYLKIRAQKLTPTTGEQNSDDEQHYRQQALRAMDSIRTVLIDLDLIDLQFREAIEQIELLHQPANQIDYWLQLIALERKSGAGDEAAKHLIQVEELVDDFIRSEWKEYLETDENAPQDIQVPIVKIWETSNVPRPILERLPELDGRMFLWLHRLGVELEHVGGTTSAEYLKELGKGVVLRPTDVSSGEYFRRAFGYLLESNYPKAQSIIKRAGYLWDGDVLTHALISRNQLIKAEELARLEKNWEGLRLLGEEYGRRGDADKVRQLAEALRANQEFPGKFVPQSVIRLIRQEKSTDAKRLLKDEWQSWFQDVARWERSNQERYDFAIENPNRRIEIECLFIQAFHVTDQPDLALEQLNQLREVVQKIPPDDEFDGVQLRSDACSILGKTAAIVGHVEITKELFEEAASLDRYGQYSRLSLLAQAGFLEELKAEAAMFEEKVQYWYLAYAFRECHKFIAEHKIGSVDFKAIQQYDNDLIRFFAELGTLEGLLSVRN